MSKTTKALWIMRLVAGAAALLFLINFADLRGLIPNLLFCVTIWAVRRQGRLLERREHEAIK